MTAPADRKERRSSFAGYTFITSEIVTISTAIELDGIDTTKPHCFVACNFFADSGGTAQAVPTVGSVTIDMLTVNNNPVYDDPGRTSIDASDPTTINFAGNVMQVRATPSGIDVATHYRIVVTCNER